MNTATAPEAAPAQGLKLVLPGRVAPLGAGVQWVATGWRLFAKAPLMWLLAILLLVVFSIVLSFIPVAGWIAVQVLTPVYTAGFAVACRTLETGGEFELDHLLAGFKLRFANLAIVGAVFLAGAVLLILVFFLFAGFSVLTALLSGNVEDVSAIISASAMQMLLGGLVVALFFIPLLAAYWFAPLLVIMHDVAPVAAMKASLMACIRNFFTLTVYGLVMLGLGILACMMMIVPILGWIAAAAAFVVLFVMNYTCAYAGWRDIFTEVEAPVAPRRFV